MSGTAQCLCFLVVIFAGANPTSCQNISDVKRLIKDKELHYDTDVRPVIDQSMTVLVYLSFYLLSIQKVNEIEQTITLNVFWGISWVDEQMRWEPKDYGLVDNFTLASYRVWTPSLVVSNSNEEFSTLGEPWLPVRYFTNGQAMYFPGNVLQVSCQLDIRFFPWDRHACGILISTWAYTTHECNLENTSSEVDTSSYTPNQAWNLLGSSIHVLNLTDITSHYYVVLFIQRQPTYVLVNVIIPVIILSLLNTLIYFIPTDSGERLSFSITLLLAIAVFLTIVGDNLPKTSTQMPVVSFYLLAVLVISNCITLSVIYSLCLYHSDESRPVGGCWMRIVGVMKCQCISRERNSKYIHDKRVESANCVQHSCNKRSDPRGFANRDVSNHNDIADRSEISGVGESDYGKYEYDKDIYITWKDVSVAFDRICFVFFLLVLIVVMTVTFCTIYNGLKE